MTTKVKATIWTIIIGTLLFGGVLYYLHEPPLPPFGATIKEELKAPKEKILESKEVDWIEEVKDKDGMPTGEIINKGRIISYDYISDKEVPSENGEEISKRIGNAKFFLKELRWNEAVYEGRFYPGTPFVKTDKWYQTETATTSIEVFNKQTKPDLISRLKSYFARSGLAASGDPIYAGAGDGDVNTWGVYRSWDTQHDATIGDAMGGTATGSNVPMHQFDSPNYQLSRGFYPVDTSGLPTGATISSATFGVYCYANGGSLNAIVVGPTTQVSPTTLELGDYDQCGAVNSPTELSDTIAYGIAKYNVFTLNATGLANIPDDSYTLLGVRSEPDVDDAPPGNAAYFSCYNSEQTGTTNDPYLTITYTVAAAEDTPPTESTYIEDW